MSELGSGFDEWSRNQALKQLDSEQHDEVERIGNKIGFGRVMQLCEQIWDEKQPGGAHSVGPATQFLVPCEHVGFGDAVGCDWCCGSGRVTKRVAEAMKGEI